MNKVSALERVKYFVHLGFAKCHYYSVTSVVYQSPLIKYLRLGLKIIRIKKTIMKCNHVTILLNAVMSFNHYGEHYAM